MKKFAVGALHLAYWGVYFLLVVIFELISWHSVHFTFHGFWHAMILSPGTIFTAVPAVMSFYIYYTLLFSRFLQTRRLLLLGLSGIGVALGSAVLVFVVSSALLFPQLRNGFSWDTSALILLLGFIAFVNGILALVMRGFINWYIDIQLKEDLKRKNAELELALIKSQVSPHFLFNTLNNIDVLIQRDAAQASSYLNKLSDILRFMLYETKTDRIPIREELMYIAKYIELQRIRTAHPEYIQFVVEGEGDQLMIEPMLFLPFVENAIKHAGKKEDGAIKIHVRLDKNRVTFVCENRCEPNVLGLPKAPGGLGNSLIRKRLLLLYPGRHKLEVNAGHNFYKTTLSLACHAN